MSNDTELLTATTMSRVAVGKSNWIVSQGLKGDNGDNVHKSLRSLRYKCIHLKHHKKN